MKNRPARLFVSSIIRSAGWRVGWVLMGLALAAIGLDVKADQQPPMNCGPNEYAVYVPGNNGFGKTSGSWRNEPEAPQAPSLGECVDHNDCVAQITNPGFFAEGRQESCAPSAKVHNSNTSSGGLSVAQGCTVLNGANVFTMSGSWTRECRAQCPEGEDASGPIENGGEFSCIEGCQYRQYLDFAFGENSPDSYTYYRSTGLTCSGSDTLSPFVSCAEDRSLCGIPSSVDGEGLLFDGEVVDNVLPQTDQTDDIRQDGCVVSESGGRICIDDAELDDGVPDDGTPGNPATPSTSVTTTYHAGPDNPTTTTNTYNFYNESTVTNSTNEGNGEPNPDPGPCDPSVEDCGNGDGGELCGAPGQPVCDVKVEEEGVEEAGEAAEGVLDQAVEDRNAEEQAILDDITNSIGDGGANNPATGWLPGDLFPSLPYNNCQTVTVEFFGNVTKQFPTPELCEAIDTRIKPTLGFFLFLFTALLIIMQVIRAMPGKS